MQERYKLKDLVVLNKFIGGAKLGKLIEYFGSTGSVLKAPESELMNLAGLGRITAKNIARGRKTIDVDIELELVKKNDACIITLFDEGYPKNLKEVHDPPILLYIKGKLLPGDTAAVALVGSRRSSVYGGITCERLSMELAARGITIVSGLARGIDSAAHRGALKAKGRTIAVLGSGLADIYPPENAKLAGEIAKNGAVISEFAMETPPHKQNFPRRNRIISGLSWGVVVVEAAERSGSLITADFALEQGREVFAVPGRADSPVSAGTHNLIKQGAKLAANADDIIEELEVHLAPVLIEKNVVQRLDGEEKAVYDALSKDLKHIDLITKEAKLPANKVAGILTQFEIRKMAKELPGKNFIIN